MKEFNASRETLSRRALTLPGLILLTALVLCGIVDSAAAQLLVPNSHETQRVPFAKQPHRINVLFLGDGYRDSEFALFAADVGDAQAALGSVSPYGEYGSSFAFRSYLEVSGQSGATHPKCPDAAAFVQSPDPKSANGTRDYLAAPVYESSYCRLGEDRLLAPNPDLVTRHAQLIFPGADVIIVLVNDDRYGGSGSTDGRAAVAERSPFHSDTTRHEVGHAFGLGDEYSGTGGGHAPCNDTAAPIPGVDGKPVGPCYANVTNVKENSFPPFIVKWSPWYAYPVTTGISEYAGALESPAYYRPTDNGCLMRTNIPRFCAVCRQELVRQFYDRAGFIDAATPDVGAATAAVGVQQVFAGRFNQPSRGLSFEWRLNGILQTNAKSTSFAFTPAVAGNYTLTVRATDPIRDADGVPFTIDSMVHHEESLSWHINVPAVADATTGNDTAPATQTASITIPRGSPGDLSLDYDVTTQEPGGRPGDDWSVIVSIANSAANPLADQHGTANNLTPVHGVQNIKVDASKGDVTVNLTVTVRNGETANFAPTHITARLNSTSSTCGVQCDPCLATPAPSYCPVNVSLASAELLPIGGLGDNSYFSLTEGDRWIDGPRVASLKISPDYTAMKSIRFVVDILRPDGSVMETLRDATWLNDSTPLTSGIRRDKATNTWRVYVTSQRQEMNHDIPEADKQATPPVLSNAQKSHEIAFNIRAIVTLPDGRVGEVSTKLDRISSGGWLGDTHLVDRPLHALWRERATTTAWWYWDSLAAHLWIEQHAGLRLGPNVFADEHAAFDTRNDHQWGTTFSEVPQYPVMSPGGTYGYYDDFRAQIARLLPGSRATLAQQTAARDFAATFIAKSRTQLDALIAEDAVLSVRYANGSMCTSAVAPDALPDRWLESLIKTGQVKAADGTTTLISLTGDARVGTNPWANSGSYRVLFTCDANYEPDIALDRCRLGETPPPCNVRRRSVNPTAIRTQPKAVVIDSGTQATLSVVADGDDLRYIWFAGNQNDFSTPIPNATSDSLTVSPVSTTSYWVYVYGVAGYDISTAAMVTVRPPCTSPAITQPPSGANITFGDAVTLSVAATGTDPLGYQWLVGTSSATAVPIGTNAPAISATPASTAIYWVRVSNACGTTMSSPAVVTVRTPPTIAAQPQPTSVAAGSAATLTLAVNGSTPVSVQWYAGGSGSTLSPVGGATSPQLTFVPLASGLFWARVRNACGSADTNAVQVTVVPPCTPPAVAVQPLPAAIIQGSAATLSISINGTSPAYQWYQGPLGNTTLPVAGATASDLTISPFSTTSYWVEVRNDCGAVRSAPVTVTVSLPCDPATINAPPASTSIITGDSLELTVDASGSDPLSYQWFAGASGNESQPIDGGTGPSVIVTPAVTTTYWVRVSNGCGSVGSTAATVTVRRFCVAARITTQPAPATIDVGGSALLSVVVAGTQPLAYQWYMGDPGDRTNPVPDAFSPALTISPTTTTNYWVEVANDCGSAISTVATVTVDVPPDCLLAFSAQPPAATTTTEGVPLTLSATAAGSEAPSYQWFSAAPNGLWLPVDGETSSSLTVTPSATTYYYLHASIGCMAIDSDVAVVTVQPACIPPSIDSVAQTLTAAPGETVTLSVNAAGTAPLSVQWYGSADGSTYTPITGAIGTSYTFGAASSAFYIARAFNNCGDASGAVAEVSVAAACTPPQITEDPMTRSTSAGDQVTLSVTATGTDLTYQWWSSVGIEWSRVGGNLPQLTVTPGVTSFYYVNVSNACGGGDSNYAVITVVSVLSCTGPPSIMQQPLPATTVSGSAVNVSVDAVGASAYQWFQSGSRLERGALTPIDGQTGPTLSFAPPVSTSVMVRVSNACGYVDSALVLITVSPACQPPALLTPTGFLTYYAGEALTIPVSYSGTNVQFQWYKSDPAGVPLVPIVSGTNATLVDYPSGDSAIYQLTMWNECGQTTSALWTAYSQSRCVTPAFTSLSPMDQTITLGQAATITATATANTPITYQWYEAWINTLYWSPIPNSNSPSITVSPTQDMWYRVVASTDCGTATLDAPIVRVVQP